VRCLSCKLRLIVLKRKSHIMGPVLTYLLTPCCRGPSWEANWFAASQEIPRISRNPKVYYRTHKPPPPISILGLPNPVHTPTSYLLEIHPNIIHPSTPRPPLHWYSLDPNIYKWFLKGVNFSDVRKLHTSTKSSKAKVAYYRAVLPTSDPTHAAIGFTMRPTIRYMAMPQQISTESKYSPYIFCSATLTPSHNYYFIHSSCGGGMLERGHRSLVQYCTFLRHDSTNHRNEILSTFPKSLSVSLYICTV